MKKNNYRAFVVFVIVLILPLCGAGVAISQTENNPPSNPEVWGPSGTLKPNTEYTFSCRSIDPDGDDVYYMWDWEGGGPYSDWLGPYPSGVEQSTTHTWPNWGEFDVRCKAKDIHGAESDWTLFPITVTKQDIYAQQQSAQPSQSTTQEPLES